MERQRRPLTPLLVVAAAIFAFGIAFFIWRSLKPSVPSVPQAPSRAVAVLSLKPIGFAALPDWTRNDARAALDAFSRSCAALAGKPANAAMGGAGYAGTVGDWLVPCTHRPPAGASPEAIRGYFETQFAPAEVMSGTGEPALFTGYYEPELLASRTQQGAFRSPIYGLPANLVTAELGLFRAALKGERISGCVDGHRLLPCPSRAEIDARGLSNAPVLFYADDPAAVFFLHIQGSGRVRLKDGTMVRVAYAGQNGRPYTPVGHVLIQRGLLARGGMSMQAIRAWMERHPQQARQVMESDQSYVFFREQPLGDAVLGSPGSEGVPLKPAASLAVDTHFHPLGVPFYIAAMRPDSNPVQADRSFDALLIAQDTGGAIRGPARGDVFWGFGKAAESIAGRMKANGRMFVLLPRNVAARLRPGRPLAPS
jgi:membrane-bound lytic murein transglycosylase A